MTAKLCDYQNQVTVLKEQGDLMTDVNLQLEHKVNQLTSDVANREDMIRNLNRNMEELRQNLTQTAQAVSQLTLEKQQLQSALQSLHATAQQLQQNINSLMEQRSALDRKLAEKEELIGYVNR